MRLIAERLEGRRGGQPLFSGIGFELAAGRALLVKGPNGAGKSTLLRIVAGLLAPAAGRVALEEGRLASHAHYLSAANAMKPGLTVAENLGFWRDFFTGENPVGPGLAVGDALAALGLESTASLPFGFLSTGQRRRAALARLLLAFRPLWILDEPASGLDARSQVLFSALAAAHLEKGGMVIAAVHDDPGLTGAAELRLGVGGSG